MKTAYIFFVFTLFLFTQVVYGQAMKNNRLIVLTDIEADPDDTESMVRLLLYSDVVDIKGLIAVTSCWQKTRVAPESIKKVIQAYGKGTAKS